MAEEQPKEQIHLPYYPSSPHLHVATRDQQKPIMKMLGRMMKSLKRPGKISRAPARGKPGGKKGLQAKQTIAIKHGRFY